MEDNIRKKEEIWKYFFSSPRKNYNDYIYQMVDFPEYIIYDKDAMDERKGKWSDNFGNKNDIYLEIGSGSGNFIKNMAERYKDRNYICLELRFKRLVLAAKKNQKADNKNVVFLRRRGEDILQFLDKNEISGIYINFPDPWEDNKKNRILQKRFFETLDTILKKNGMIFFKSDHDGYYQDILDLVETLDGYETVYHTDDLHHSTKAEDNIKTEFEQLFLCKHNKNINYIEIRKI